MTALLQLKISAASLLYSPLGREKMFVRIFTACSLFLKSVDLASNLDLSSPILTSYFFIWVSIVSQPLFGSMSPMYLLCQYPEGPFNKNLFKGPIISNPGFQNFLCQPHQTLKKEVCQCLVCFHTCCALSVQIGTSNNSPVLVQEVNDTIECCAEEAPPWKWWTGKHQYPHTNTNYL